MSVWTEEQQKDIDEAYERISKVMRENGFGDPGGQVYCVWLPRVADAMEALDARLSKRG